jgi:alkylation response protein AidB-like acyl-CoA dehydrogenase
MRFHFDEDQLALRDAVRGLCADRFRLDRLTEREGQAVDAATWAALADMGALGVLSDSEETGLGPVEASVMFEEFGASLASGPLLWSVLAAPFVDGAADGVVRVCGVLVDDNVGPVVVEHGREADVLVILRPDRIELCAMAEVVRQVGVVDAHPFDPLTPTVVLDSLPSGRVVAGDDAALGVRRLGAVLVAAMLVGSAQGSLDVARTYALQRQQFEVPVGSFQAVKHLLADMYVRVELARASTHAAAAIAAEPRSGSLDHAAARAKLLAGEAGIDNGRAAVQILGGMGFTWDMLPHYFLKRCWALENQFGTASIHGAHLAGVLGERLTAQRTSTDLSTSVGRS